MVESEDKPIVFTTRYATTRRKYELLAVSEVDLAVQMKLAEIDECTALVEPGLELDGECEIMITVSQRLKRRNCDA